MERKDTCVDTEEGVPAHHFHVPILEVEGVVRAYGRRVRGRVLIKNICDLEIGQGGNADGGRLGGRR